MLYALFTETFKNKQGKFRAIEKFGLGTFFWETIDCKIQMKLTMQSRPDWFFVKYAFIGLSRIKKGYKVTNLHITFKFKPKTFSLILEILIQKLFTGNIPLSTHLH